MCMYCSRQIIQPPWSFCADDCFFSDWNSELHKGSGKGKEEYVYTHSMIYYVHNMWDLLLNIVSIVFVRMDIREAA